MNDFAAYQEHSREPPRREEPEWDSDRSVIFRETDNPNGIFTSAPKEAFKLGYFDVMCLVLNRMIGKCSSFLNTFRYDFSRYRKDISWWIWRCCVEVEFKLRAQSLDETQVGKSAYTLGSMVRSFLGPSLSFNVSEQRSFSIGMLLFLLSPSISSTLITMLELGGSIQCGNMVLRHGTTLQLSC